MRPTLPLILTVALLVTCSKPESETSRAPADKPTSPAVQPVAVAAGGPTAPSHKPTTPAKATVVPRPAKRIKIVTPGGRARLCPAVNCGDGQQIARLSTGAELEVLSEESVRLPMWDVLWFRVTYKGKEGWVSEFDTNLGPKEPQLRK